MIKFQKLIIKIKIKLLTKSISKVGDLFVVTKGLTYGIKKESQIYNSGCISNSDCNNNSTQV